MAWRRGLCSEWEMAGLVGVYRGGDRLTTKSLLLQKLKEAARDRTERCGQRRHQGTSAS